MGDEIETNSSTPTVLLPKENGKNSSHSDDVPWSGSNRGMSSRRNSLIAELSTDDHWPATLDTKRPSTNTIIMPRLQETLEEDEEKHEDSKPPEDRFPTGMDTLIEPLAPARSRSNNPKLNTDVGPENEDNTFMPRAYNSNGTIKRVPSDPPRVAEAHSALLYDEDVRRQVALEKAFAKQPSSEMLDTFYGAKPESVKSLDVLEKAPVKLPPNVTTSLTSNLRGKKIHSKGSLENTAKDSSRSSSSAAVPLNAIQVGGKTKSVTMAEGLIVGAADSSPTHATPSRSSEKRNPMKTKVSRYDDQTRSRHQLAQPNSRVQSSSNIDQVASKELPHADQSADEQLDINGASGKSSRHSHSGNRPIKGSLTSSAAISYKHQQPDQHYHPGTGKSLIFADQVISEEQGLSDSTVAATEEQNSPDAKQDSSGSTLVAKEAAEDRPKDQLKRNERENHAAQVIAAMHTLQAVVSEAGSVPSQDQPSSKMIIDYIHWLLEKVEHYQKDMADQEKITSNETCSESSLAHEASSWECLPETVGQYVQNVIRNLMIDVEKNACSKISHSPNPEVTGETTAELDMHEKYSADGRSEKPSSKTVREPHSKYATNKVVESREQDVGIYSDGETKSPADVNMPTSHLYFYDCHDRVFRQESIGYQSQQRTPPMKQSPKSPSGVHAELCARANDHLKSVYGNYDRDRVKGNQSPLEMPITAPAGTCHQATVCQKDEGAQVGCCSLCLDESFADLLKKLNERTNRLLRHGNERQTPYNSAEGVRNKHESQQSKADISPALTPTDHLAAGVKLDLTSSVNHIGANAKASSTCAIPTSPKSGFGTQHLSVLMANYPYSRISDTGQHSAVPSGVIAPCNTPITLVSRRQPSDDAGSVIESSSPQIRFPVPPLDETGRFTSKLGMSAGSSATNIPQRRLPPKYDGSAGCSATNILQSRVASKYETIGGSFGTNLPHSVEEPEENRLFSPQCSSLEGIPIVPGSKEAKWYEMIASICWEDMAKGLSVYLPNPPCETPYKDEEPEKVPTTNIPLKEPCQPPIKNPLSRNVQLTPAINTSFYDDIGSKENSNKTQQITPESQVAVADRKLSDHSNRSSGCQDFPPKPNRVVMASHENSFTNYRDLLEQTLMHSQEKKTQFMCKKHRKVSPRQQTREARSDPRHKCRLVETMPTNCAMPAPCQPLNNPNQSVLDEQKCAPAGNPPVTFTTIGPKKEGMATICWNGLAKDLGIHFTPVLDSQTSENIKTTKKGTDLPNDMGAGVRGKPTMPHAAVEQVAPTGTAEMPHSEPRLVDTASSAVTLPLAAGVNRATSIALLGTSPRESEHYVDAPEDLPSAQEKAKKSGKSSKPVREKRRARSKGTRDFPHDPMVWKILDTEYREIYSQGKPILESLAFFKKCQPLTSEMSELDRYVFDYVRNKREKELGRERRDETTPSEYATSYLFEPIRQLWGSSGGSADVVHDAQCIADSTTHILPDRKYFN